MEFKVGIWRWKYACDGAVEFIVGVLSSGGCGY